jgi:hypothetical protein
MRPAGVLQLGAQWFDHGLGQHGGSVALSLRIANEQLAPGEVDVLYTQVQRFQQARPPP